MTTDNSARNFKEYVTAMIGGQLFGLPISRVQDVFMPDRLTRVPLAAPEIAGVLNLRGRIVTAIDMRRRLGLAKCGRRPSMAIGVESRGESYGLLIDSVGEVLKLDEAACEPNPINLDPRLARVGRHSPAGRSVADGGRCRARARYRRAGDRGVTNLICNDLRDNTRK